MKLRWFFTAFLLIGILGSLAFKLPNGLLKKVEREVQKVMDTEQFALKPLLIDETLNKTLPSRLNKDNFFRITRENKLLGYAFVDKAPSKTAEFDYLVILSGDLLVIHTKVLIYREEYGGEIGSKRWLKQFIGKTGNDRLKYQENIDAISGATISVRSMTRAMDSFLQTVKILHNHNII